MVLGILNNVRSGGALGLLNGRPFRIFRARPSASRFLPCVAFVQDIQDTLMGPRTPSANVIQGKNQDATPAP